MKNKEGSALLYVVLVIFLVIIFSGFLINLLTYEVKMNKRTEEKIKAKYIAEAGIEHAMLETGSTAPKLVKDEAGNPLYEYSVAINAGKVFIESYGYVNNEVRMKIECTLEDDEIKEWKETPMK
ncbi:MAG: hypothetical protein ACM3TR_02030 [Caulobacteraceae bacterium]